MNPEGTASSDFSSVVPIRADGSAMPLFFIHGVGGVLPDFPQLIDKIDPKYPIYGIQSQALDPVGPALTTLEEMAAYYIGAIRQLVPQGSFLMIGYSFGGMVAFEVAQQLLARGEALPAIVMIDSTEMSYLKRQAKANPPGRRAGDLYLRLRRRLGEAVSQPQKFTYVREKFESRFYRALYSLLSKTPFPIHLPLHAPYHVNWFAAVNYAPRPYEGAIVLFKAKDHFWEPGMPPDLGWASLARRGVQMFEIPGDHTSMFIEPSVSLLAGHLSRCLESLAEASAPTMIRK